MKKIFFILSIIFYSSNLAAEIINKIVIQGNERISNETIKVYGDIKENDNVDEFKINQILKDLYSTNFFEDVKVRSPADFDNKIKRVSNNK